MSNISPTSTLINRIKVIVFIITRKYYVSVLDLKHIKLNKYEIYDFYYALQLSFKFR